MALVIGENSYLTLVEAQSIVEDELYSDSPEYELWSGLDEKEKEIICRKGTMAINSLEFKGTRQVWQYKLKFPRIINGIEVLPQEVKIAAVMNGLIDKLVSSSEQYKLARNGVKSIAVGPDSVSLDTERLKGIKVYDEAKIYINSYIRTSVSV